MIYLISFFILEDQLFMRIIKNCIKGLGTCTSYFECHDGDILYLVFKIQSVVLRC